MLRTEARGDKARDEGKSVAGGDFYGPFWADVKEHVFGGADLRDSVRERISKNTGREKLYPVLRDGFLSWWDEQRRWTNEPFQPVRAPSTIYRVNELLSVRIEGMLAVQDADGEDRYIYPYFYSEPSLRNEAARIGLWVFRKAFVALPPDRFRILDVPRGRIYAADRCYLEGNESEILEERFEQLWTLWEAVRSEYR
jgi:hypothetical protein